MVELVDMRVPPQLCDRCRRLIAEATARGMQRAWKRGASVGRPRTEITAEQLELVRTGVVTTAELAAVVGCCSNTIRRRLQELPDA